MTRLSSFVVVLCFAFTPSIAQAQWHRAGVDWYYSPSDSPLGGCFGNCGAGCSGTVAGIENFNICGGPNRYWDLEIVAGPEPYIETWEQGCLHGIPVQRLVQSYIGIGRWTFHGWGNTACAQHDITCGIPGLGIGCLFFLGCAPGGGPWVGSYDEWMIGYGAPGTWQAVEGPQEPCGGQED